MMTDTRATENPADNCGAAVCEELMQADLLDHLRARHPQAQEQFVRLHAGRMLATARRFFACEQDCADAVQDAFISAFASLDRFAGDSRLSTWLHRIVVNACLMKLRSRARKNETPIDDLLPTFDDTGHHVSPIRRWSESPLDHLESQESRNLVRSCIDRLPEDYRQIILIRDIEEIETEQTAAMLGLSVPNVKTRLHRARQALRTLLDPLMNAG